MQGRRKKLIFSNTIYLGDSLSDRGTMAQRKLLKIIPMRGMAGLGDSPKDRFSENFVWTDYFTAHYANQAIVRRLKKETEAKARSKPIPTFKAEDLVLERPKGKQQDIPQHMLVSVVGHAVLTDAKEQARIREAYTLGEHQYIPLEGDITFARSFCEGGMTAANYKDKSALAIPARKIVSSLGAKREELFADDAEKGITEEQKKYTLTIELSGPNDLLTVNKEITDEVIEDAIKSRIKNVEEMFKQGYRNFVLINLPDISYTPRFQNKSPAEREAITKRVKQFNQMLQDESAKLIAKYPDQGLNVDIFDTTNLIKEIYEKPEKYGFDKSKLHLQMKDDPHGEGYLFWDDIHVTSKCHLIIQDRLQQFVAEKYDFQTQAELKIEKQELDKDRIEKICKAIRKRKFAEPLTVNLRGNNLSGGNLKLANLAGIDMRYGIFAEADFWGADLTKANLSHANLTSANLTKAKLAGADLSNAKLDGATITSSTFDDSTKLVPDLPQKILDLLDIMKKDKSGDYHQQLQQEFSKHLEALKKRIQFPSTLTTDDANKKKVLAIICKQIIKQMGGADIKPSYKGQMLQCLLADKKVRELLHEFDFLKDLNLSDIGPLNFDFYGINLSKVVLMDAKLWKVNFTDADLSGCILMNAYLTGAVMKNTRLMGANLCGCDLTGADLSSALYDAKTKYVPDSVIGDPTKLRDFLKTLNHLKLADELASKLTLMEIARNNIQAYISSHPDRNKEIDSILGNLQKNIGRLIDEINKKAKVEKKPDGVEKPRMVSQKEPGSFLTKPKSIEESQSSPVSQVKREIKAEEKHVDVGLLFSSAPRAKTVQGKDAELKEINPDYKAPRDYTSAPISSDEQKFQQVKDEVLAVIKQWEGDTNKATFLSGAKEHKGYSIDNDKLRASELKKAIDKVQNLQELRLLLAKFFSHGQVYVTGPTAAKASEAAIFFSRIDIGISLISTLANRFCPAVKSNVSSLPVFNRKTSLKSEDIIPLLFREPKQDQKLSRGQTISSSTQTTPTIKK